ncbi:MAG: hypothetical protein ACTSXO_04405 [Candidatus Heimdallarchaeota archaeon]|nr:MAG: hypothetical protein DRP02_04785 [Candidatus Gerdarchaeota archaeon]RLI72589.1 MAG: hypothetical protein DRO91_04375 [Candidatus Heimdallarchaeota archaeon]
MRQKDYLFGFLIVIICSIIFVLPADALYLIIPSILIAGAAGGMYVGYVRKRPLISCVYDGFILGILASLVQAAVIIPILWYYHNQSYDIGTPLRFVFLIFALCLLTAGFVGGPFGGLIMGLFYRYLRRDRGEADLYESYLETKTQDNSSYEDLHD